MIKLVIAAGLTISAILCGMMTLRSNGLFQNSNKNFELINDIKEIFGLYPIGTSNSQLSSKSGEISSFSLDGGGGYLPPKSLSDDDNSTADMTTPVFRIYVISNATSINDPAFTIFPATQASSAPTTPSTLTPITSFSTKSTPIKEETLTEVTTASSPLAQPPITPYAFQGNPMPGFKIDLVWSTLVPPALSNSENEVTMNEETVKSANNLGSPAPLPNNGLYLPPNKEYLPPKQ